MLVSAFACNKIMFLATGPLFISRSKGSKYDVEVIRLMLNSLEHGICYCLFYQRQVSCSGQQTMLFDLVINIRMRLKLCHLKINDYQHKSESVSDNV